MRISRSVTGVFPVLFLAGAATSPGAMAETLPVPESQSDGESPAEEGRTRKASAKPEVVIVTATGRSNASASTKTRTPIIESPQTISIVSREEIELRASPTVADALSYTAGVQAEPSARREGEFFLQGAGFTNFMNRQGRSVIGRLECRW